MHTASQKPLINRLVVVGLGLIGSSFAKGIREAGLAQEVIGVDLNEQSCARAVELGIADRCSTQLLDTCRDVDVIMLAVPVLALSKLLKSLAQLDLSHTIITDTGSVKGHLLTAAQDAYGQLPKL